MIDGRLLVPAVAAWLGAALHMSWGIVGLLGGLVAVLAGLLVRSVPRSSVVVGAVVLVVGASAAGLLAWRLSPEPLDSWVSERATSTVVGSVAGEPTVVLPDPTGMWWQTGSVTVVVNTSSVTARGVRLDVHVPIQVRAPIGTVVPPRGSSVVVTGRLAQVPLRTGWAAELRAGTAGLRVIGAPGPWDAAATGMRTGLAEAVAGAPEDAAVLVRGLTLGDDSGASPQLTEAMRASGLAHLTAVSGGNVAIVVGLVVGIATALRLPLWVRVVSGLLALAYYAFLVGPEPSVLRASVMGAVVLVGVLVGGRRGGPTVLATGVLALVLIHPALAVSWGFALSACATAGIVLLAPEVLRRLRSWPITAGLPPVVGAAVALTVAAQLATLPILVAMGGAAGWVSVPANLAAMPAVAPVTVLGLMAAVTAPVAPAAAEALGAAAAWPARWIARVAYEATRLPASDWPSQFWPSGWTGVGLMVVLAVLSIAAVLAWSRHGQGRWQALPHLARVSIAGACAIGVCALVLRPPTLRGWPPPDWLVVMCDVGQGDSLLLRSAPDAAVVVDTGSDPDRVDACLGDAGVRQVPAVVLTHFHADHVMGLAGVLAGREVGVVLSTPVELPSEQAAMVREVLAATGRRPEPITAGDTRRVGQVAWRALWPRRLIEQGSVPNNASVVLVAEVAGRSILLTGDIEPDAQRSLLADVVDLDLDIVKVPHHGSRHQSPEFALAVRAPVVLISVGAENDYGHPAPEAIDLYTSDDAVLLRTDLLGDVAVVADGMRGLGVVSRGGMLPSS